MRPWGPPARIGCIDADLPICANGVGVKSQDVRILFLCGLKVEAEAEADARSLLKRRRK